VRSKGKDALGTFAGFTHLSVWEGIAQENRERAAIARLKMRRMNMRRIINEEK